MATPGAETLDHGFHRKLSLAECSANGRTALSLLHAERPKRVIKIAGLGIRN
jgi:hypothetical protein